MDAVIKMASTHMERGGYPQALQEYSEAVVKSSSSSASPNPDIYYHRGQARHITGDIVGAIEDFRECIKICPEFLYSHIQLAVALYKQSSMMAGGNPGSGMFGNGNSVAASPVAEAGIKEAIAVFENAKLIFKERMEVDLYMGEILMDMGKTDDGKK